MSVRRVSATTWLHSLTEFQQDIVLLLLSGLIGTVVFTGVMAAFKMFGGDLSASALAVRFLFSLTFSLPMIFNKWFLWLIAAGVCVYKLVPTINTVVHVGENFAWYFNVLMILSYPLLAAFSIGAAFLLVRRFRA